MGADVTQGAGSHRALVAPGDRNIRVGAVIAPVPPLELHHLAERPAVGQLGDLGDRGVTTVTEADSGDDVGPGLDLGHRLRVLEVVGERLLAEDVLTGLDQGLGDLAVQPVGHHDRDDVDVVGGDDVVPAGGGPLVAVGLGRGLGEGEVGVADRGEADIRDAVGAEHGADLPPCVGVGASRHARADDGDGNSLGCHGRGLLRTLSGGRFIARDGDLTRVKSDLASTMTSGAGDVKRNVLTNSPRRVASPASSGDPAPNTPSRRPGAPASVRTACWEEKLRPQPSDADQTRSAWPAARARGGGRHRPRWQERSDVEESSPPLINLSCGPSTWAGPRPRGVLAPRRARAAPPSPAGRVPRCPGRPR